MRILSLLFVAALAAPATAQITSGYYTDGQGYSCRIEVSDTNGTGTPGLEVTVTDAGGSAVSNGTQSTGSSDTNPIADSFAATTTPRGNTEVRGNGGRAEKRNANGTWTRLRKYKGPKRGVRRPLVVAPWAFPGHTSRAPSVVGSLLPPPVIWRSVSTTGEELGGLPGPGSSHAAMPAGEGIGLLR